MAEKGPEWSLREFLKQSLMLDVYNSKDELIATASGFVVKDNNILVTNYHVIENANYIAGHSDDGYEYILNKVYIADDKSDLALIGFYSPTNLVPLTLGTDEVQRAEPVVAIGSPKGLLNTVSMGNVSAVFEEDGVKYIQFTAPISSGSSGGALFDDDGNVIGISTMVYDDGGIVQNLNFAVDAREVVRLLEEFDEDEYCTFSEFFDADKSDFDILNDILMPSVTQQPSADNGNSDPLNRKYETLQKGDKGDKVRKLQISLFALGYLDSASDIDGIYGEKTAEAISLFNNYNQLGDYRVATNKTQVLLFDGKPLKYEDPEMILSIPDQAYAEWIKLDGDRLKIHFQVQNIGRKKTVKAFEIYVYAEDVWGEKIYGNEVSRKTSTTEVGIGEIVYSDYLIIPDCSQIERVYCGIHKVAHTDGTTYEVPEDEIEYCSWNISK